MSWLLLAGLLVNLQEAAPDQAEPAIVLDDIEIHGRRGAARLPPVVELDGAQIDAFGAWSIGEVLQRLDELYGGTEQAMVLVNGRKVPVPGVFTGFPPDAAVRIEVLPPQAAGLYGGRAGQTVYNLVLQPRYASQSLGLSLSGPDQGGTTATRLEGQRSVISGMDTHNLSLGRGRETALRAGERALHDGMDPAASLRPESRAVDLSAMMTRNLMGWNTVASLNGRRSDTDTSARFGEVLRDNRSRQDNLGLTLGLSRQLGGWFVSSNANLNAGWTRSDGFNQMTSETRSLALGVAVNREVWTLPGGPLMAHLNATTSQGRTRTWQAEQDQASRSVLHNLRASISAPLIRAGSAGWGRIGGVQVDAGLGRTDSGGEVGEDQSLALAWQPATRVRLNARWSRQAPGIADLLRNEPLYYGTPRTVFDFRRGEAVEVLALMGGNPDLVTPRSEEMALSASLGPFTDWKLTGMLNLARREADRGLGTPGDLSEEIEASFPDRFLRDADGRLVQVDFRPLNLGSSLGQTFGANLSLSVPVARFWPEAAAASAMVQGRLGYSRHLTERTRLVPGGPEMDSLKGDGGGRSPQNLQAAIEVRVRDISLGLNLRWQDGYRSRRLAGVDGAQDLVREDLLVSDLNLSWRLAGQAAPAQGDGPRRRSGALELALSVSNLLDARPRARLGDGSAAPGFERDRQDPIGRSLKLSLRRRF